MTRSGWLPTGWQKLAAAALVGLALIVPAYAQAPIAAPYWQNPTTDLTVDPAVRRGFLPNGMAYAILPNHMPAGAVSMRFVMAAGSLNEGDTEQGLVHFVEHMAFNGTTHVPEGEMVARLQRLGLRFGGDANAATSRSETVYRLDLPSNGAALDEGLFLLREVASEIAFEPTAIDRERGVVLAEMRRNDTFERRRADQQLAFLIPGSYAASRWPIGVQAVIENASQDQLVGLYRRLYRPDRALLIVVGDVDADALAARVTSLFGDWRAEGVPSTDPSPRYQPADRQPSASSFTHPDGGDSIAVYALAPYDRRPDTAAERRRQWLVGLAAGALTRRFTVLAEDANPPFLHASLNRYDMFAAVDIVSLSAAVVPGGWRRALEALAREWRRARDEGFTRFEVQEQIAAQRVRLQQAVDSAPTRTTLELASSLLQASLSHAVFTRPADDLALFKRTAKDASPQTVLAAFRRDANFERPLFLLATTIAQPGAEPEIPSAWRAGLSAQSVRPAEQPPARFAYTNFGPPGRLVADSSDVALDARMVRFANNVRLTIKKTAFEEGTIRISLRVGDGMIGLENAPPGVASLTSAYVAGGLEKHSVGDLRTLMTGHFVQAALTAYADAFGGVYTTTPADLDLQLQLLAAYVMHPGYAPEAEARWRQSLSLSWGQLDSNAENVFASKGARLLLNGDRRFGTDPDDGVTARSFTEFAAYAGPMLKTGAVEIAIVGDVDETTAINAVARTFGALPTRGPDHTLTSSRHVAVFRPPGSPILLSHRGEQSQAVIKAYWPVSIDPDADQPTVRTLTVLANILRLKVTESVRETLGASYAPSAGASVSAVYPGLGYVFSSAEVKPEDVERARSALKSAAGDLRAGRISPDELQRAVRPLLEQAEAHEESNGYWLSLLSDAQSHPDRAENARLPVVLKGLAAVSIAEVTAAANRWLNDDQVREVIILPAEQDEDDAAS
jgi:zinc protease